ncbi:diguanylate cyclase domain-containing protein [Methylibium petroleiphilum]
MADDCRRVLLVGSLPGVPGPAALAVAGWGRCTVEACASPDEARERLRAEPFDALLLNLPTAADVRVLAAAVASPWWQADAGDAAVLVTTERPSAALAQALLERGVQALLPSADLAAAERLLPALHQAVVRQRLDRLARRAYATDLATGLPNQMQLLEHVNHLLALREREPAPMALVVIHLEGLTTAATQLASAAELGALRRKLAVRLRAALRASDVVASVGADAFAVLLAWIDTPTAADRVAAKLVRSLTRPVRIGTHEFAVAARAGIARYPEHGKDAGSLWRQASAAAEGAAPLGRAGFANHVERGPVEAANDERGDDGAAPGPAGSGGAQ